jgi:hypothetical protein
MMEQELHTHSSSNQISNNIVNVNQDELAIERVYIGDKF